MTLPEDGPAKEDTRIQLLLSPVGRIAASLRHGAWDDDSAPVENFPLDRLREVVDSFNGVPIYGAEFFDVPENEGFARWSDRLSLDFRSGTDGLTHTLTVFQNGNERHLDVQIWFDDLVIRGPSGNEITVDTFIEDGVRWWDAFWQGGSRTRDSGIYPLKG